ncbi:MAG: NUDIX hydrolase [Beijerinckiaceae bacterium]|nr:NUDIX hydrolase [Beijerinckiaceae bacterium]MCI0735947.1 NUDIX hydrolase [Beijerinckiaceae bacterium]
MRLGDTKSIAQAAPSAGARQVNSRYYPRRPYIGVSAAVFRSGKVLVAKRTGPPFAGGFSLPGGLVEPGETLKAAALRELREEVQIEARIVAFNCHVEFVERDLAGKVRHHFVIASFAGEWIAGEAQPGPEADDAIWVDPAGLMNLNCTPNLAAVVEAAKKLLDARVMAAVP